jgi:hypothetical protein
VLLLVRTCRAIAALAWHPIAGPFQKPRECSNHEFPTRIGDQAIFTVNTRSGIVRGFQDAVAAAALDLLEQIPAEC